jgi:hypothetical protein
MVIQTYVQAALNIHADFKMNKKLVPACDATEIYLILENPAADGDLKPLFSTTITRTSTGTWPEYGDIRQQLGRLIGQNNRALSWLITDFLCRELGIAGPSKFSDARAEAQQAASDAIVSAAPQPIDLLPEMLRQAARKAGSRLENVVKPSN